MAGSRNKDKSKADEAASGKWFTFLLACIIIILASLIIIFVYSGLQLSSSKPAESSEEERMEWMRLLSGQEFLTDKVSKDARLEELLDIRIDSVVFDIYDTATDYIECSFLNRKITGNAAQGYVTNGKDCLICDTGNAYLEVWLEKSDDPSHICLVMQGKEERLILNPLDPTHF